jgi:hypothetical protein
MLHVLTLKSLPGMPVVDIGQLKDPVPSLAPTAGIQYQRTDTIFDALLSQS